MIKKPLRILPLALILVFITSAVPAYRVAGSDSVKPQRQSDTAEKVLIEQFMAEHDLDHAFVGVAVQDLKSGKYLLSYNADRYFTPASNQKLITTWAALKELGPDFNYETECYVEAGSDLDSDDIDSDLLVKGHGSPSFRPSELADRLSSKFNGNEKRFKGNLIIDV
ncbi:D-alanyl-D-alanine carboxypeptidase, partial [Candidatus Bipolaricaulota bacterium]|nr:D-alanyl-D-alanine carboxypeptidase [Candidatus Bipolaricaulota bacterium]